MEPLVGRIAELVAPLRSDPARSAVLCDIDGTLAPIVRDPAGASVSDQARAALRELARRFALVACVSGRRAVEARRLVGVEQLTYAGNHGLELLRPGARRATLDPAVADVAQAARDFALGLDPAALRAAGLRVEDKGPIQSLHWRGAVDQDAAERRAREIADQASSAGLEPHWGRKVLEIRPRAAIDKGTAVRRLLSRRNLVLALFGGDDRTDLDAFRALRALVDAGELRAAACIGIGSEEAPAELSEEADAVVAGPGEFLELLRVLARPEAPEARARAR